MGKCVKVDLRTAERLGGSIERVGVYHFTGPRILINSPRIYTTSSFPPLLHLFLLLLLLPKQQTLPQCMPGGLSPQSRQPSWSLPRALRSCRLSLVSLCRPRVLPACSLIREWGGWSEFVCVCVCIQCYSTPSFLPTELLLKISDFGQLAWQLQSHVRSVMTQWTSQWSRLSCH